MTSLGTIQAFEQAAIAREAEGLHEHFEERAGILEFDAGLPGPEVELEAARTVVTPPGAAGLPVGIPTGALTGYPVGSVARQARPGGCLAPESVPKVAVLKDKRVVRP